MNKTVTSGVSPKRPFNPIVLGVLALLVVACGLFLPQMLPDKASPSPPASVPETASKDTTAKAQDQPTHDASKPNWSEGPDARTLLMRLGVGTGVVLILCVVALRFGRRWLAAIPGQSRPGSQFQLTETFSLGNRCFMHLVRVGKQQVLVGVDSSGLKSMIPMSEPFESVVADLENETVEVGNDTPSDRQASPDSGATSSKRLVTVGYEHYGL